MPSCWRVRSRLRLPSEGGVGAWGAGRAAAAGALFDFNFFDLNFDIFGFGFVTCARGQR